MIAPGTKIDRYVVEATVGQGGMGTVFAARDERLGRRVALKVVALDEADPAQARDSRARVLREARAAALLNHPNAVAIYDVGEVESRPYIAMELVEGESLRAVIHRGDMPRDAKVRALVDAARALAAAHEAGLVHRDVKPENVMVRRDGCVKVLDFGIARPSQEENPPASGSVPTAGLYTLTEQGVVLGTLLYMAPEQLRGQPIDARADQFAWGVLAYELLTGAPPWSGPNPTAIVASILTDEPEAVTSRDATVPAELAGIVHKALAKKKTDRFASMTDVIAALEAHANAGRVEPAGAAPRPAPRALEKPDKPATATEHKTDFGKFSTEELKLIVERALVLEQDSGGYAYREVVEAARELGVDEQAVRQVARELRLPPPNTRENRRRAEQALHRHAGIWGVVGAVFLLLGGILSLIKGHAMPLFALSILPMLWGMAVGIHAVVVHFPVEPAPPKLRGARRRKLEHAKDPADARFDEAALELVGATRARIAVGAIGQRVNTMDDGLDDRLAEEDAELAERDDARHEKARTRRRARPSYDT